MALVVIAILIGACVQSASGFGFTLIASPVLFAVMEPGEALTTVLALTIALNVLILFGERRRRHLRVADLRVILIAAIPGMAIGLTLLDALEKSQLQILIGLVILVALALHLRARREHGPSERPDRRPGPLTAAAGLFAGTFTTTTGTTGPPMMLWFEQSGASPAELRDSMSAGYLALSLAGGLILALFAQDGRDLALDVVAGLLIVVVVGHQLGRVVFERLEGPGFRRIGLTLVLAAAVASIVAGAFGSIENELLPLSDLLS